MKKIFLSIILFIFSIRNTFALENFFGKSNSDVRNGNFTLDDIPNTIGTLISLGIRLAGSVAIIFVIIGAYKILFGSIQGKNEGKDTVIMALMGLVIAISAWFIIKLIFDNFG